MIQKYEKPLSRNLGDLPVATGNCASGNIADQACRSGYTNVGPCTVGSTAGQGCTDGSAPSSYAPCTAGTGATNCGTGTFAGVL